MTDSQSDEQRVAPAEFTYRGPRPGAVSGAAAIQIVFGILAIILTLADLNTLGHDAADGLTVDAFYYDVDHVQPAFSVAQVAVAVFLVRGQRWARVVTLAFCGLSLLLAVIALIRGQRAGRAVRDADQRRHPLAAGPAGRPGVVHPVSAA